MQERNLLRIMKGIRIERHTFSKDKYEGGMTMSRRKLGPKQQEHPDLPKSVQQGYGEKISGSHKVKTASHSRQNQKSSHDM